MNGSAAQPSLPHDELEAAYGGCRLCYGKGYATTISYSTGSHYSKQDPVIRCCTCGRGEQLQALIQAQRQEAVREALEWVVKEHRKYGENQCDALMEVEDRLAALQTYLEGE